MKVGIPNPRNGNSLLQLDISRAGESGGIKGMPRYYTNPPCFHSLHLPPLSRARQPFSPLLAQLLGVFGESVRMSTAPKHRHRGIEGLYLLDL